MTLLKIMNKKKYFFLALFFLFQIAFIQCYLPFKEWFTNSPIYSDDFSIHYGCVLEEKEMLNHFGSLWSYNPFFRAGSITQSIVTVDSKGWGVFITLFSFLPTAIPFKLYYILIILTVPFVCYLAARYFEFDVNESLLCSFLGVCFLHVSICIDFIYWGTGTYITSCYLSVLATSLFYNFLKSDKIKYFFLTIAVSSLSLWTHFLSGFHLVFAFSVCLLAFIMKLKLKTIFLVICLVIVMFVIASPMVLPLIKFLDTKVPYYPWRPYFTDDPLVAVKVYFFQLIPFNKYKNIPFQKSAMVDIGLLLLSLLGFYYWWEKGEKQKLITLSGTFVILFSFAYYSSFFKAFIDLTPLRYVIAMNVFLLIPATAGLVKLYDSFLRQKPFSTKMASYIISFYFLFLLLSQPLYHLYIKKDFRLSTEMPNQIRELLQFITKNTTNEGRILVENSGWESNHQYYGTHLTFLFHPFTGRDFIGAEYSSDPFNDAFVSFYGGELFHRPLSEYTLNDLDSYFKLYNIKWIVCWSEKAVKLFEKFPDYITLVKKVDKFYIFEVKRKPSFFLKGEGEISVDTNKISLKNVRPGNGEIIISYHWMKYLKTLPEVKLEKIYLLKDPVGFIRIINPSRDVVIYNGY